MVGKFTVEYQVLLLFWVVQVVVIVPVGVDIGEVALTVKVWEEAGAVTV